MRLVATAFIHGLLLYTVPTFGRQRPNVRLATLVVVPLIQAVRFPSHRMMKTHNFLIRHATSGDYKELGAVMFDAVRNGDSFYSQSQREAWVPVARSGSEWNARLDSQTVFVAEDARSLQGFMSLAEGGYLDFAFIRPKSRGCGMFRALYNEIEATARRNNVCRVWVHSSLMARPAFAAVGFRVTTEERVQIGDSWLDRFEMEKRLVSQMTPTSG